MTPRSLLAPGRLAGQPVLRTQSDERLVDLVRAGSAPAFEAIVARYRRPLLRYCSGLLSAHRAEDAVQQTFVKAHAAMVEGDAELKLRPWLYRIAHNTALNVLRDHGVGHEPLDERLDGVELPEQALERRQGLREVLAAVQALPTRQRDAIVLRELEGRSYEEIAAMLGVTGGAVRQLLNRARTTLRSGATALTPVDLLARVPATGEPVAARVAELCGAAGAGAVAAKLCATALVTGAVVGGAAVVPPDDPARDAPGADAAQAAEGGPGGVAGVAGPGGPAVDGLGSRGKGSDEDRSGPGSGDGSELDSSGPSDSSGPGHGGETDSDSSGPGSDGSGSGSGHAGSGDSDSSGSGSSGSGSGSSGSGSGDSGSSGSGDSGSDSSGSGSSGSGSGSSGSG
jgi:RNA polymerase sigma factor (sigma-70 family)